MGTTSWQEDFLRIPPASANEGKCINGNCVDGKGALTLSNGTKYIGEFKNGSPDGQGVMTYSNGTNYIGEFKNGLTDGPGTYSYADGTIEKGVWLNNVWHVDEKQQWAK